LRFLMPVLIGIAITWKYDIDITSFIFTDFSSKLIITKKAKKEKAHLPSNRVITS